MAESKHGPPSSRSWRGRDKATNYDGPSKFARIFWSTVFVGLIGALVWRLSWQTTSAQLAAVRMIYEHTTPIPFSAEDAEAFCTLDSKNPVLRVDCDRSDTIAGLWKEGKNQSNRGTDPVVIYVAGRGVSDADGTDADGRAWLLCSDYDEPAGRRPSHAPGRYSLRNLLTDAKQRQAPLKLLILDVSFSLSDPGAAMLVNEFPALVNEETKRINDPTLWVLTNSRALEVEHFSPSAHRSAFSYFVTEGLRGEAYFAAHRGWWYRLPGRNANVYLDDLYRFVHSGVGDWLTKHHDSSEGQTPGLFHAGEGLVAHSPAGLTLRSVVERSRSRGVSEPAAAGQEAVEIKLSAAEESLKKAWEQRDAWLKPTGSGWTIGDCSPHLWRDYERLLLDYEFRLGCGTVEAKVEKDLREKVVQVLDSNASPEGGAGRTQRPSA